MVLSFGGRANPDPGQPKIPTAAISNVEAVAPSPQGGIMNTYCVFYVRMLNSDRYLRGDTDQECGLPDGSPPWGNFGVDSNLASRADGYQYEGWKMADGWDNVWSACSTSDDYDPPDCRYYNANGCTEQQTDMATSQYASMELWMKIPRRQEDLGCEWFDGHHLLITGNFQKVWELDDASADDLIDEATHADLVIPLECNDFDSCEYAWVDGDYKQGPTKDVSRRL